MTAPAAPAFATLAAGFALPRRVGDGPVGYPLIASGGVALFEFRAKVAGVVHVVFDATSPRGERQLRIEDTLGEHPFTFSTSMHFDLNVEVPRGVSQLVLKTEPAATSEADAVVLSQPRLDAATGAAALHAIPSSPDPGF